MLDGLPITIVDIIILVVVVLSGGLAAVRGFVREFLSILSWAGAALIAIYGYPYARPYANELTDVQLFADAGTGIVLFVISLAILSIISSLLSGRVKESAVGPLDRALGFLFGVVRGVFLVCLVYIGVSFVWEEADFPNMVTTSKSYPAIKSTSAKLLNLLPAEYRDDGTSAIDKVRKQIEDAAMDAAIKDQFEKLSNPAPKSPGNDSEQSYGDDDRSELESLIEETQ